MNSAASGGGATGGGLDSRIANLGLTSIKANGSYDSNYGYGSIGYSVSARFLGIDAALVSL